MMFLDFTEEKFIGGEHDAVFLRIYRENPGDTATGFLGVTTVTPERGAHPQPRTSGNIPTTRVSTVYTYKNVHIKREIPFPFSKLLESSGDKQMSSMT